jgi:hypothetical protein
LFFFTIAESDSGKNHEEMYCTPLFFGFECNVSPFLFGASQEKGATSSGQTCER